MCEILCGSRFTHRETHFPLITTVLSDDNMVMGHVFAALGWAAIWHLLYWLCRAIFTFIMPGFAEPSEKMVDEYTKKLQLRAAMPRQEKIRRVGVYFRNYWTTCVLSFAHSVAMVATVAPVLWTNPNAVWSSDTETTFEPLWLACHIFMGYMLNDLACVVKPVLQYRLADEILFIGHHGAILIVWASFCYDDWGHVFAIPIMLTEVTGLPINLKELLDYLGLESTVLYMVNGAAIVFSWYYLRLWKYCVVLSVRLYQLRACFVGEHGVRNSLVLLVFLFGFGIQCWWGYVITRGAIGAITGDSDEGTPSKSKGGKGESDDNGVAVETAVKSPRRSPRQRRRPAPLE
jgi:hypothetical protein